jgi:hypothetical protein
MMSFQNAALNAGIPSREGLQALEARDRRCIVSVGVNLTASINVDAHFAETEARSNRWDYGIGYESDGKHFAIWVEPHSATSTHEITTMIRKFEWLKDKLATEPFVELQRLTTNTRENGLRQFWWVTTGKISIRRDTPQAKRLAASGINYPERQVQIRLK